MPEIVLQPRLIAATATTSDALAVGYHTPVDATSGDITMTLPTGLNGGANLSVEKVDTTSSTVTISGNIRGGASTVTLKSQYQTLIFEWFGTTWRPTADHRTSAAIDAAIDAKVATQAGSDSATYAPLASPSFNGTVTGVTKSMVGLGNVDNTADTSKPVSTAQQTALNGKLAAASNLSDLASPTSALANLSAVAKGSLVLNVKDYGAVGDGTTNDTAAIQAALTAVPTSGATVYFPAGVYSVPNGGLTCTHAVRIVGVPGLDGTGSRIVVTADAVTGLSLSGSRTAVEHLNIAHPLTGTRSAALIGLAVSNANFAHLDGVRVEGFATDATIASGIYYSVVNSNFRDFVNVGLDYSNSLANGDAGDGTIQNCTFDRGSDTIAGGTAVLWHSGGGMRFENNKINGKGSGAAWFQHGVQLIPASGANTGVVIITGNSIENFSGYGVSLTQGSSTFFNTVIIGNNEINGTSGASGNTGIWLDNGPSGVTITGNHLYTLDVGIELNRIEHGTVEGNALSNIKTSGIIVHQFCRDIMVGRQVIDMQSGGTDIFFEKPWAMADPGYEKTIPFGGNNGTNMPAITDTTVHNLFEIAVSSFEPLFFDVSTTSHVAGTGSWAVRQTRTVVGAAVGADVTVNTVGTDYALNNTLASLVITATGLGGVFRVGVQMLSGTDLAGVMNVKVRGAGLVSVKQLQRYN